MSMHKPTPNENSESQLYNLNGSMQQGSSSKADRSPLVKKYSAVYANTNIHYRIYNATSFVHILSQINPIHSRPHYFFTIHKMALHPKSETPLKQYKGK